MTSGSIIGALAASVLGQARADDALSVLDIAPTLLTDGPQASREEDPRQEDGREEVAAVSPVTRQPTR